MRIVFTRQNYKGLAWENINFAQGIEAFYVIPRGNIFTLKGVGYSGKEYFMGEFASRDDITSFVTEFFGLKNVEVVSETRVGQEDVDASEVPSGVVVEDRKGTPTSYDIL